MVAVLFSVLSICAFKRGTARRVSGVHWCMPRRRQMVDWLLEVAAWLHSSCDRVEVVARTGVAFFQ